MTALEYLQIVKERERKQILKPSINVSFSNHAFKDVKIGSLLKNSLSSCG